MNIKSNPAVEKVINNYPEHVAEKLMRLREIILETASEIEEIKDIEETLKWGEPSYLVKKGSTVRINWKNQRPISMLSILNAPVNWWTRLKVFMATCSNTKEVELFHFKWMRAFQLRN